jgi:hypothetical protein
MPYHYRHALLSLTRRTAFSLNSSAYFVRFALPVIASSLLEFICSARDLFYEGKLIVTNLILLIGRRLQYRTRAQEDISDLQNLTI